MNKFDREVMVHALGAIQNICEENHKKKNGCVNCPANGKGKLCHSGSISCCAPHGWYSFNEVEELKKLKKGVK